MDYISEGLQRKDENITNLWISTLGNYTNQASEHTTNKMRHSSKNSTNMKNYDLLKEINEQSSGLAQPLRHCYSIAFSEIENVPGAN